MATRFVICGAAGRMGRTLCAIVRETPGAELAGAVEATGSPFLGQDAGEVAGLGHAGVPIVDDYAAVAGTDTVALDFTAPTATLAHVRIAVERGAAIAVGTTGFRADEQAELERLAVQTRCLIAPNMSVGVAVLQRVAFEAAQALGEDFDAEIVEMHHRLKVDAPSGTALALAKTVADAKGRDLERDAIYGREGLVGKRTDREIGVLALRGGGVIGDHTVVLAGAAERLELTHRAQSRDCLARGAVRAGLWLINQPPGRYEMGDVLGFARRK
jgi:4-hydroxy-tetrahydrodipicolinate reductase